VVVDDSNGNIEAEGQCPPGDYESILAISDTASDDRVDGHVKLGVPGKPLQPLV
jgi:hypothetical protein